LAGHVANALECPDLLHRNELRARCNGVAGENEGRIVGAPDCDCAENGVPQRVIVEPTGACCAAGMRRAFGRAFVNGRARRGDPHGLMAVSRRPQAPAKVEAGTTGTRGAAPRYMELWPAVKCSR
jgi:hypothetical protein